MQADVAIACAEFNLQDGETERIARQWAANASSCSEHFYVKQNKKISKSGDEMCCDNFVLYLGSILCDERDSLLPECQRGGMVDRFGIQSSKDIHAGHPVGGRSRQLSSELILGST